VNLAPGERKTLSLQLNSTIDLYTTIEPRSFSQRGIELLFEKKSIGLGPKNLATMPIDITVLPNTIPGRYTLSMPVSVRLPYENFSIFTEYQKSTNFPVGSIILQDRLNIIISIGNTPEIFQFTIPTDTLISIFFIVITAIVGWFIPSIARWINAKRQGKYVGKFMTAIIEAYNLSPHDKSALNTRLQEIKNDIARTYAKGKISETHYKILNDKLLEYVNKAD